MLLLAFLGVEERRGDSAMMPLTMFASRRFTGLTIVTLLLYGALGGLLLLLPYVLIKGGLYSGTATGGALLPIPLGFSGYVAMDGKIGRPNRCADSLTVGPASSWRPVSCCCFVSMRGRQATGQQSCLRSWS